MKKQETKQNNKKPMLTIVFIVFVMFLMNAATLYTLRDVVYDRNKIIDSHYEDKAIENMEQNITKTVGDYCLLFEDNMTRVKCARSFVINSKKFNYTITDKIILSDELIENGGDCKSWTTFYKGLFNYMNIKSNLIHTDGHVYLNAFDDTFYCNVDQQSIDCHKLGGETE